MQIHKNESMKLFIEKVLLYLGLFLLLCCQSKTDSKPSKPNNPNAIIKYAKGLSIVQYKDVAVVTIEDAWPHATEKFKYILYKNNAIVPDSLKEFTAIPVPIKTLVATSTTFVSALEMLDVENALVGFPHLEYISSPKVRQRIEAGFVKELGNNQALNIETIIDLNPDIVMAYGIDQHNPELENLQKSGLKVIVNGDWNEQSPLGKAEWLKLYGLLFDQEKKANEWFQKIEKSYQETQKLATHAASKPTVLCGAMIENQWFMPQGDSWGSLFIKEANATYLWGNTHGTGSLSLSFEAVLEKAQKAQFWIGPGDATSLADMPQKNIHYTQFDAYKKKQIYTFSTKKGPTGGVLYYEMAPNRPDLVLLDLVKILHPELLPNHQLLFFDQLQ